MGPARSAGLPSLRQARAPPAMMGGWAALVPSGATWPSGDVDGRKARAPWPLTSGIPVLPSPPPRQLLRSALCGHRHLHEGAAVPEFGRLASGRCRRGRSRVSLRSGNECALGGSHGAAGGARCLHRLCRWAAGPLRSGARRDVPRRGADHRRLRRCGRESLRRRPGFPQFGGGGAKSP